MEYPIIDFESFNCLGSLNDYIAEKLPELVAIGDEAGLVECFTPLFDYLNTLKLDARLDEYTHVGGIFSELINVSPRFEPYVAEYLSKYNNISSFYTENEFLLAKYPKELERYRDFFRTTPGLLNCDRILFALKDFELSFWKLFSVAECLPYLPDAINQFYWNWRDSLDEINFHYGINKTIRNLYLLCKKYRVNRQFSLKEQTMLAYMNIFNFENHTHPARAVDKDFINFILAECCPDVDLDKSNRCAKLIQTLNQPVDSQSWWLMHLED